MGTFMTSATICIMNGDFFATPPSAITPLIGTPSRRNLSAIAFAPKAVASTRARKILGAPVPRLSPVTAPFRSWFASGVLLPFIQSIAITPVSSAGKASA